MMIKENKGVKTKTYDVEIMFYKGFKVDITDNGKVYGVWLYHDNIGIKSFMFGGLSKETSDKELAEMVSDNLWVNDYINDYIEEYHYKEFE